MQAPERQRGPGRIATAIRPAISRDRSPSQSMELHTPLSQLVRGCASPRQTALASTAYPLPAGKDVFLNFGPVSSDAGPLRSYRVCRMRCRRGFRVRAASRLRSSLSANRWLNRSPASLPLSLSMRSWNGLRTWSKVIRGRLVAVRGRSGVRAGDGRVLQPRSRPAQQLGLLRHRPRRGPAEPASR